MTLPRLTWTVLCATLAVCACAGSKHTSIPLPSEAPEDACVALVERCELTGEVTDCDGADACIGLWERASLEWSWRRELEALAGVDAAVAAGHLARLQQDLDHARLMRWVWGAVGAAIGAAAVGVGVGAAR